jgi:hypothetical protein
MGSLAVAPSAMAATPTSTSTFVDPSTIYLGQSFQDTAFVNPATDGSVDFAVYGPDDPTCSQPPVLTSGPNPVVFSDPDASATSDAFTPTATGVYQVVATYSGSATYDPSAGACGDPNEQVTVNPRNTVTISTNVSSSTAEQGAFFTDTATLDNGNRGLTGTVTFDVYGPDDANCTGKPESTYTSFNQVFYPDDSASVESADFQAHSPGTYRVVASYSGDYANAPVTGACTDPNEQVQVSPAVMHTLVSVDQIAVGSGFSDTASFYQPPESGTPTGTVTFDVYGPGDSTCTSAPAHTSTVPVQDLSGQITPEGSSYPDATYGADSDTYVPQSGGDYQVIATYNGDASHPALAGACGDPNEQIHVTAPHVVFSPTAVAFPAQTVGTIGPSRTITITNDGDQDLAIRAFVLAGANPDDYLIGTDSCRQAVVPGSSCKVNVRFTPQDTGDRTAALSVEAPGSGTAKVTLTGNGTPAAGGPKGDPGAPGSPGAPGAPGANGTDGSTGATGPNGATGTNGTNGSPGPAGPTGATGPNGAPGAPGANGTDGTNGRPGRDGTNTQPPHKSATYYCQKQGLSGRPLGQCVQALVHLSFNAQTTRVTPRRACSIERKRAGRNHRWSHTLFTSCVRGGKAFQHDLRT